MCNKKQQLSELFLHTHWNGNSMSIGLWNFKTVISGCLLALIERRFVISLFSWIYITQDYINNGIQKNIFTWRIHLIRMSKNCCNYVCGWTAGKKLLRSLSVHCALISFENVQHISHIAVHLSFSVCLMTL